METIHRNFIRILGAGILIALIMIFSSCTTTKEVRQERRKATLEEKLRHKSKTESQTTTTTDTRTITDTRTTETVDTMITIPEKKISGAIPQQAFDKGQRLIIESGGMSLEVFRDSVSGLILAGATKKPQNVSIQYQRTTDRREAVNQNQQKNEDAETNIDVKQENARNSESKDSKVEVNRFSYGWVILLVILTFIAGLGIFWVGKRIIVLFFNKKSY